MTAPHAHAVTRRTLVPAAIVAVVLAAGIAADQATAARQPVGAAEPPLATVMPRVVASEHSEIVLVQSDGDTTVYTADGPAWAADTDTGLRWPTDGKVTSEFGWRNGRMHNGMDISAPTGTPIVAAADGEVVFAGWKGGYGRTVDVDHGDGVVTRYAHQSATLVAEGDGVDRGDRIGNVGTTGYSTGPHLHFEVHVDGEAHDPRNDLQPDA